MSPLSPTTRELVARLDAVIAANPQPGSVEENALMAQHVRAALRSADGASDSEPLFTEDILKMAFTEIVQQGGATT